MRGETRRRYTRAMSRALVAAAALIVLALAGCVRLPTSPVADPDPQVTVEPAPVEEDPTADLPLAQQQAILKAESYLSFSSFSRSGLIDQLVFEGFSKADATFGVDYLNVDWNEQAAGKAASYLETSSFSKQALIDQLLFEGFTKEQAAYGVQAVGY